MLKNKELGIIYLAFGRPYLAMALVSYNTVRETNPDIPVCILTNVCKKMIGIENWRDDYDVWTYLEIETIENRKIKTQLYKYTPFEKTLYIDSDTLIVGDLSKTSLMLDYFDICIKLNGHEQSKKGRTNIKILNENALINDLPHWNGGVIFFKNNKKVSDFFDLWYEYYKLHKNKYDQISLVEAIFRSDCRLLSLDSRWNYKRKTNIVPIKKNVKIHHYVTDMTSKKTPKIDNLIVKQILKMAKKIPGGELPENYLAVKQFFDKINAFREKKKIINLIKKFINKI